MSPIRRKPAFSRAERRLSEAGAEVNRLRAQRAGASEILPLTKSATSAVT